MSDLEILPEEMARFKEQAADALREMGQPKLDDCYFLIPYDLSSYDPFTYIKDLLGIPIIFYSACEFRLGCTDAERAPYFVGKFEKEFFFDFKMGDER